MSGTEARRSRRAERKEETRAELIEAARRVFAREGFHGASIEQIAREAGYTSGAVYWHFSGKDELFLEVASQYYATRVQEFETLHAEASGELPQRARVFADHWMQRFRDDPSFMVFSLEFLGYVWRRPELREQLANRAGAGRDALARILGEAADGGGVELPLGPGALATVLRELGVGLALAKLADPEAFPDALFGDFVELFFALVTERNAAGSSRRAR